MNALAEILAVAVPGGSTRDGTVLRAVFVPRLSGLDPESSVDAYGLGDWPDLLRRSTITIEAALDEASAVQSVAGTVRQEADSQIWRAMFGDVRVLPRTGQTAYEDPHVVPSSAQLNTVRKIYATVGSSPDDPAVVSAQLQTVPASTLPPPTGQTVQGGPEDPDFHRLITFFREHPAVLRALGLIIQIDIADPLILSTLGSGLIRLGMVPPASASLALSFPWTRFGYSQDRFLPLPAPGSDIHQGMLDLGGPQWKVACFDVAATMDRLRLAKSGDTLPAIRSTGLSLLREGRERQLRNRNRTAAANAARRTSGLVLWADDLVLGYRVDARSSDTDWAPLCRRSAAYKTGSGVPLGQPGEEEGHVKAQGATFRGESTSLLADETVIRWDGWSMVCPHPEQVTRTRAPGRWLNWEFEPVSVPSLRFGETYRVRMRVADLAGGGLRFDDPEPAEAASAETFYGRHDPVPPPEIALPTGETGPGGLIDVLVIRSDPGAGLDVAQYSAAHPYPANDRRMFMPPPAPFVLCDQSGAFDTAPLTDAAYAALFGRATTPPAYLPDGTYSWLPDWAAEGVSLAAQRSSELEAPPFSEPKREAWTVPSGQWPDFDAKHVRLISRGTGEKTVDWTDGFNAVVRLDPAETLTVEVSSTIGDINPFAMTNWLRAVASELPDIENENFLDRLMALVRTGRHPLVSPPRRLLFVHAVQHPKSPPTGTLVAAREQGQTFASLRDAKPEDNPWFGLHPPSTAQLDIAASWPEWDPMGTGQPLETRSQQVGSFSLDLAASSLPELRHELGDTRHRLVTYTLTALSRFRDYFDAGAEVHKTATFPVNVPNCATPAEPKILAVTPAFSWQTTVENGRYVKFRRGGLLRVELARPWHLTGQDEQLGVVVNASRIRLDPIHDTPVPSPLGPEMFRRAVATLDLHGSIVAAHNVHYDEITQRWFADIEIDAPAESYFAFTELTVVRLQQSSLPGCHASPAVRADSAQLLPDRTLTCWADPAGIRVRLDGTSPSGNLVRATIERLPAGFDPAAVELTALSTMADGIPAWLPASSVEGQVATDLPPLTAPAEAGPTRLVVEEFEHFDESAGGSAPHRTVFLDIIKLPVQQ